MAKNYIEMANKKYNKRPTGWENEAKKEPVNYDVKASHIELIKMFYLLRIKFDIHMDLAMKENKTSTSLTGIHQQYLKLNNAIAKLYV